MMTQAATDEDGVSWIDDTSGADTVAPMESSNLTPAEVCKRIYILFFRFLNRTLV